MQHQLFTHPKSDPFEGAWQEELDRRHAELVDEDDWLEGFDDLWDNEKDVIADVLRLTSNPLGLVA